MRLLKIALFLLTGLLIAAAVAVGMLFLVDPNVFHERIETAVSKAFGRPFHIDGAIGLERSLRPKIILREIAIGNPDWATGAHFARAGHVAARVALLPLLRGKLQVLDLTLTDMEINLEDGPEGANNYTLDGLSVRETVRRMPSIEQMLIDRTILNYRPHTGASRRIEIVAARLSNIPGQPERITAEGVVNGEAFAFTFRAAPDAATTGDDEPWSIDLDMQGAGLAANLKGRMPRAFAWQQFDGRVTIRGEGLDKLDLMRGMDLPPSGPFGIKAVMNMTDGTLTLNDLQGRIKGLAGKHDIAAERFQLDQLRGALTGKPQWDTFQVNDGRMRVASDGSMNAAIDAQFNGVPLALALSGDASASDKAGRLVRPFQLQATAPETEMTVKGTLIGTGEGPQLEITTRIQGERLDTLGALAGITVPPIGPYALEGDLLSSKGNHALTNLHATLGGDRLTGQLKWQGQTPRPMLTGRLAAEKLTLKKRSSPAAKPDGKKETPIDLSWLKGFDARLDIDVKQVTGFPVPIKKLDTSLSIANGRLTVPFHARVGGAPCEGQLDLIQPGKVPRIDLKATAGKIDTEQIRQQMDLPEEVQGTIEAVRIDAHTSGRTLAALLDQTAMQMKLHPVDLRYNGQFAARPMNLVIAEADIKIEQGRPLSATFKGTFQGIVFDAQAHTARLADLRAAQTKLPVRLTMQAGDVVFKGRGTVTRPLGQNVFDLEHEFAGSETEGLDPLIDLALPLQGAFSARGTITGRGDRLTYVEELQVGNSDFKMTLDMWQKTPRPHVKATITSETIHLEDIKLLPGNEPLSDAVDKGYLIPEYELPVDYMRSMDLDIDIRAQRVLSAFGELGQLESKVTLKAGHFESTAIIAKLQGGRVRKHYEVDATADLPVIEFNVDGDNIDYGFLHRLVPPAAMEGGTLDFDFRLSGTGTTRRQFLSQSDGLLTIIGGPGQIYERRIDLWAADLIPTLLSPQWEREEATDVNCMVAHIGIVDGLASIESMLLDTERVTIAASGTVDLKTEALDIFIAPRPKDASLVSLANAVNIKGNMSAPEISVAKLPGRSSSRLARTGILASLINPLFLITILSDTGTIGDDACTEVTEQARQAMTEDLP